MERRLRIASFFRTVVLPSCCDTRVSRRVLLVRISDGVRLTEAGRDLSRAGAWVGIAEGRRWREDARGCVERHGFFAVWPELLGIPVVVTEEYGAVLSAAEYARFSAYMDRGVYAQHVYVPVTIEDPVVLAERVARCLHEAING